MDWKVYEKHIHDFFLQAYPDAEISHNTKLIGRYSKVERQIDILVESYIAGNRIRIVIDGKFFKKRIDVKQVETFIGMLNDCEAHKGLMITQKGYTSAAINRAYNDPLDIDLDILNFDEFRKFQSFGGVVHLDNYGAIVPAPFGWVIDGTKRDGMLATFYQQGLEFQDAVNALEWIYVNIWPKNETIKCLDDLLNYQLDYILSAHPKTIINFLPTIKRNDANTKLRCMIVDSYPSAEYTGFVEFSDFIFFCVLFTPEEQRKKNIRKLEEIMLRIIPLEVTIENELVVKPS